MYFHNFILYKNTIKVQETRQNYEELVTGQLRQPMRPQVMKFGSYFYMQELGLKIHYLL